MDIKINAEYKGEFDQEASKVDEYAGKIKSWRSNHPEPDEGKVRELEQLYGKLEEHSRALKRAIERYYGINI
jgi:hypothetical protein